MPTASQLQLEFVYEDEELLFLTDHNEENAFVQIDQARVEKLKIYSAVF